MALTYDQISSITKKYYMPTFPQLVYDTSWALKKLSADGTKVSGGEKILQTLMYAGGNGGFYDPYDEFNISGVDQATAAEFNWKYLHEPIVISRDEQLKNSGPEAVKKLLDAKVKMAALKAQEDLSDALFAITTASGSDSSTALNSLDNMLNNAANTLATGVTYGGILKSTYTWWAGNVVSLGGNAHGPCFNNMTKIEAACADGNIRPKLCIMSNNAYFSYLKSLQAEQRFIAPSEAAKAGFQSIMYNGMEVVMDAHVSDADTTTEASNRIYMLNTDFVDLVTHKDENMRFEPFAKPVNQAVSVAYTMWAGELTCSDPSRSAVGYNFDSIVVTE